MSTALDAVRLLPSARALSYRTRLWVLAAGLVVTGIGVEWASRVLHEHRRITCEMERGVQDAVDIRRTAASTNVLFAGNSLVYEGISREAAQRSMGNSFVVHTSGIPGSTYDDWRYGLRALFRRGGRPDVIVFGISPSQFLRHLPVTPLPVSKLWGIQEILAYARDRHPSLTTLSELVFEHYSTFFYMRDTVRKYARKGIPGFESMVEQWSTADTEGLTPTGLAPDSAALLQERLAALKAECEGQGRLILIVVPTNQPEDDAAEPALRSAAAALNLQVIEPVREREWPESRFQSDRYHLNAAAAADFSTLVGARLSGLLAPKPDGRHSEGPVVATSGPAPAYLGRARSNLSAVRQ